MQDKLHLLFTMIYSLVTRSALLICYIYK